MSRQVFEDTYDPSNYVVEKGDFTTFEDVIEAAERQNDSETDQESARIVGRVATARLHKNYGFIVLNNQGMSSDAAEIQVIVPRRVKIDDEYITLACNDQFLRTVQAGSYVVAEGMPAQSRSGEPSLLVEESAPKIVAQSYISPYQEPGSEGLDREEKRHMFELRHNVRSSIRRSLEDSDFIEVITPFISNVPSGANAEVFETKVSSLDTEGTLRISPELSLKTAIINGYGKRVYEMATDFRNEGIDREHIPEFEMLEFYASFMGWEEMRDLTEDIVKQATLKARGTTEVELSTESGEILEIDLGDWKKVNYRDVFLQGTGIDLDVQLDLDTDELKRYLLAEMREQFGPTASDQHKQSSVPTLIDKLFKYACRTEIQQPTFVETYPSVMVPLARPSDADARYVNMFQGIVASMEIIKGYQELNDPVQQLSNLIDQSRAKEGGDTEAMPVDWAYITSMLKGLPPTSGCGIGIDRLTAIIGGTKNVHRTQAFPFKERFQTK